MPTPPTSTEKRKAVIALKAQGFSHREIKRKTGVAVGTVSQIVNGEIPKSMITPVDKKKGEFSWREWSQWIEEGQELRKRASWSNESATIKLGNGEPVILAPFSDQHVGAWGADYSALRTLTDEILKTDGIYLALLGDYAEYAIKLRSVLETCAQVLPPDLQTEFIESWFEEIWPKVAFATWDNHGVERQEKQAGESSVKRLLSRKVTYFNGIGHVDIQVGKQIYKIACSHRFRQGSSMMNPVASQMRYMRFEGLDREIAMQGDTHKPGLAVYRDGAMLRCAMNCGTLHVNSGYAKRYFSLFTTPDYPCLVLYPDEHRFQPYWSIADAKRALGK